MANLGFILDSSVAPESTSDFPDVPEGTYTVEIVDVEMKTSAAGHDFVACRYEITGVDDPDNAGFLERLIFDNFNVNHPTYSEMSRENLTKLANAIGLPSIGSTEQLERGRLKVRVYHKASTHPKHPVDVKVGEYIKLEGAAISDINPTAREDASGVTNPGATLKASVPWAS